jgi:hypothetical protein
VLTSSWLNDDTVCALHAHWSAYSTCGSPLAPNWYICATVVIMENSVLNISQLCFLFVVLTCVGMNKDKSDK